MCFFSDCGPSARNVSVRIQCACDNFKRDWEVNMTLRCIVITLVALVVIAALVGVYCF